MGSQDFRSLQEAYMEVVEKQQLDEISVELAKRAKEERWNRTGAAMEKDRREGRKKPSPEFQASYKKAQDTQRRYERKVKKEQVDLYDIILSHLLDEGYAETPEAAEVIMVNMSEEWIDSIVENQQLDEEKDKTGYGIDTYASKKYFGDKEKQEKLMRRMNRLSGNVNKKTPKSTS